MSGCPTTKPVDEGIDAYCRGVPRSDCPYAPGTPEHRDWLCGWDEAEALDFEEYGDRLNRWIRNNALQSASLNTTGVAGAALQSVGARPRAPELFIYTNESLTAGPVVC